MDFIVDYGTLVTAISEKNCRLFAIGLTPVGEQINQPTELYQVRVEPPSG